eukprot:8917860-Pyramimonas_sp.AAC.1
MTSGSSEIAMCLLLHLPSPTSLFLVIFLPFLQGCPRELSRTPSTPHRGQSFHAFTPDWGSRTSTPERPPMDLHHLDFLVGGTSV